MIFKILELNEKNKNKYNQYIDKLVDLIGENGKSIGKGYVFVQDEYLYVKMNDEDTKKHLELKENSIFKTMFGGY
jgi:membrane-bound ClpP family serine protease